jgi:hypothetical protein
MSRCRRPTLVALALACTGALSCRDAGLAPAEGAVTAPDLRLADIPDRLLQCRPLDYDSVTEMIGPAGGVLRVSKHVLSIPFMALSHPVRITLVVPADTVNRIQLQPEGLVFDAPVTLTMSYVNCDTGSSTDPKQIAYTDDSLSILEYEPSVDDFHGKKVTGQLTHFSQYAVTW